MHDVLVPAHYGAFPGGVGTLARGLLRELPRHAGPEIRIVVPALPRRRRALAQTASLGSGLARLRYEQLDLAAMARRTDTVHLIDSRPIVASRAPFVMTVHDVAFLDNRDWYPPAVTRYKALMLRVALLRRPAAIVFDSNYGRERLLEHHSHLASRAPLFVIPPGLDDPPPKPAAAPAIEHPYFLTVGAVEPRRNHLTLLRAFERARAEGLNARWVVAGPAGHLSAPIIERLLLADGVEYRGFVPQAELELLYRGATFLATPSLAEGFGYPPLEAMAREVPVLCSRGSGLDETAGDSAVRVAADDEDAWADQLLRLENDAALRSRLVSRGRAHAAGFAWRDAARALLEIHRGLAR